MTPLLILLGYTEYRLAQVPNSYNTKRRLLESKIEQIEIISLGSSHAYRGINPNFWEVLGFNLANSNQSLYYDYRLMSKYVDKMKNLKLVIVPVSYFSLETQLGETIEDWRSFYYFRFWGIINYDLSFLDISNCRFYFNCRLHISSILVKK